MNEEDAWVYFKRGVDKFILKNYAGAISDYTRAIEIDPSSAFAYANRGDAKSNLKAYSGAIADFTRAIELRPKFAYAYVKRGYAKYNLKDCSGAIADFKKALEMYPNYYLAKRNLKLAEEKKELEKGVRIMDKSEKLKEDAHNYDYKAGNEKTILKDYSGAIDDYTKAIEIKPNDAYAYNNRGFAKSNLSDYLGAIADYTKALEIDPNCSLAKRNLKEAEELLSLEKEKENG